MTFLAQQPYTIRFEWGLEGVSWLAPGSDAVVIVDVLSFSTCVAIAVERGATVFPYRFKDATAAEFAESLGAVVAGPRSNAGFSLSPVSLLHIPTGTKFVLPSPNGATLSLATDSVPTLAGCLRNATAVAGAATSFGQRITVIAAGERWPDGSTRFAVEDMIGAGAIIHRLPGRRSPEALLAEQAFLAAQSRLTAVLHECASGRELVEAGFTDDVALATEVDASDCAPLLRDGAYRLYHGGTGRTEIGGGF